MTTANRQHSPTIRGDRATFHETHEPPRKTDPSRAEPAGDGRGEATDGRSLSGLLRELRDEAMTLVQKEMQLARAEIQEKISETQRAVTTSVGGAAMLLAGLFTLAIALSAALYVGMIAFEIGPAISLWAAPLIVGVVIALIGYGMVNRAKKVTRADHWRPERTERSVRETKQWAERKM